MISVRCKSFACDICRTPYPLAISVSGRHYSLLGDLEVGRGKLLLAILGKEGECNKTFYLIGANEGKDKFVIGRSKKADVQVSDRFVSRLHALIKHTDKGFALTDMNSKYGTLVLLRRKQELHKDENLSVQVNNSIVTLGVKEKNVPIMHCNPNAKSILTFKKKNR
eukprot:TRINITY_DN6980_c0_g1_i18.p1 TRINITY_DN6980_c0_g1~~TRINITY_DN6980_c0_g1_i18.p1  ORF type:complete len:166 (-),score=17.22 TRINITY_DN6980_c0_g1_i18:83-580(-)